MTLANTLQILNICPQAATRRLQAAFAKLNAVGLLEIGLHNPLAGAIDPARSEWVLTLELIRKLPARNLLLAAFQYGFDGIMSQAFAVLNCAPPPLANKTTPRLSVRVG